LELPTNTEGLVGKTGVKNQDLGKAEGDGVYEYYHRVVIEYRFAQNDPGKTKV
jgi:hypothetical protein